MLMKIFTTTKDYFVLAKIQNIQNIMIKQKTLINDKVKVETYSAPIKMD